MAGNRSADFVLGDIEIVSKCRELSELRWNDSLVYTNYGRSLRVNEGRRVGKINNREVIAIKFKFGCKCSPGVFGAPHRHALVLQGVCIQTYHMPSCEGNWPENSFFSIRKYHPPCPLFNPVKRPSGEREQEIGGRASSEINRRIHASEFQ